MILVVITDPAWTDALKRLLTRISSVLIPLSVLLIRCFPSLGRRYSIGGAPQWTGVGSDKNALGMLCMIYGVSLLWRGITVYLDRSTPHRSRQLTTIALIFMMDLYLILVADSQTALSCFLMASLLIIVTALFKAFRRPALVSLLVAAMLGVAFCALFLGIGSSTLSSLGRDASLTGRTDVWRVILPFATNPWVGAGYESFWIGDRLDAFKRLGLTMNQAHNGYIEIYLNIGWVGLVILGIVIVAGYRNIMKGFRYRNPEMTRLRLAYFFICLVYNFTEASFKMMSPVWMMFLWSVMVTRKVEADKAVPQLKKRTRANIEVFSNEPGPRAIEHPVVPV
jgi:O-antigen ligase